MTLVSNLKVAADIALGVHLRDTEDRFVELLDVNWVNDRCQKFCRLSLGIYQSLQMAEDETGPGYYA